MRQHKPTLYFNLADKPMRPARGAAKEFNERQRARMEEREIKRMLEAQKQRLLMWERLNALNKLRGKS